MISQKSKFNSAFTLIEVMVAMVILSIASVGALGYQYFAAKQAKIGQIQVASTNIAQLLLEDWKSTGGSAEYAESGPLDLGIGFAAVDSLPVAPSLCMAGYSITVDDVPMVVILNWVDVDQDDEAKVTLRKLAVMVLGGVDLTGELNLGEIITVGDRAIAASGDYGMIAPFTISTYVRLDASGG